MLAVKSRWADRRSAAFAFKTREVGHRVIVWRLGSVRCGQPFLLTWSADDRPNTGRPSPFYERWV